MPLRVDSRQQARLQKVPILPGLPPEPSLESAYTGNKTDGLTRVFQVYDRARKEWAAKVAQHLGRMQDAILAIGSGRGSTPVYPNRGWTKITSSGMESSTTTRPDSAWIAVELFWSPSPTGQSSTLTSENWAYGSHPGDLIPQTYFGPIPATLWDVPSTEAVLRSVRVLVANAGSEITDSSPGILRVAIVPKRNSRRSGGSVPTVAVRATPGPYFVLQSVSPEGVSVGETIPSEWNQIHYFEPYWPAGSEAVESNDITNADLAIDSVYAELV